MNSWRTTRILTATGAAAAVLALGVAGGAAHATSVPDPAAPPWMAGLMARSEALNQMYGLGDYAKADARSEALNKAYGLGTSATPAGSER
jgi:hypothetical protein